MEFRLLGTIELRAGGRRSGLDSGKARCTLAALAYDVGRPVSLDTLIHRIWDDDPPRRARENLYTYASRIRTALRKVGGPDAPALTNHAHTYVLEADPESVDVRRYLSLTTRARALAESGDAEQALRLLDEAGRLWRGEPLTGLSGSWAEHVRATAEAAGLAAALTRAGLDLRLGRFADAVPELSALAARHPTHEALAGHLALALHGCGRTAEATHLLRQVTHRLVTEHGTDPGEELQRVQHGILNGSPAVRLLPRAGGDDGLRERTTVPDNLPHDIPWVGRTDELHRLATALTPASGTPRAVVALEAIDGMAGVGKTALAVHTAHELRDRFPDGRLYLNLGAHASFQEPLTPEAALGRLLRLIGVPADRLPRQLDELTALWRTLLADRHAIVVLDDAAGPEQVRPLLPGATPSQIVITSRRRLTGLPGVRPISLDVLRRAEAVALFHDRVGARRPADEAQTAEIVRLCGYLPLAIEMAASRFLCHGSWTARDLVDRLARPGRLAEIRDGSRDLARTFAFSYRSLTPVQQSAFHRLSLHIGSEFGVYAAAALTGLPFDDTERVLEDLLNFHLLEEPTPYRYRIHDLLREYARTLVATEHVDDPGGDERAVGRLTDFYLFCADRADRALFPHRARTAVALARPPAEAPAWLDPAGPREWFATEAANLLALVDHARRCAPPRRAALLAHVLGGFLESEGLWTVAEPLHEHAVAYWRDAEDRRAEARSLLDLSAARNAAARYDEAVAEAGRALALSRATGDREAEPEALRCLALPHLYTGRNHEALAFVQEALSIHMRTSDRLQQARCLNNMGFALFELGRHPEALECFLDALSRFREIDDRRGQGQALNNTGEIYSLLGLEDRAIRAYTQALALARAVGGRANRATVEMNLANALMRSGEVEQPLALCRQALATFRDIADRRHESIALNTLGRALGRAGQDEEDMAHQWAALALARRIGAAQEEGHALRDLAAAETRTGRFRKAEEHLTAALAVNRRVDSPLEEAGTLDRLAELREATGAPVEARELRREAAVIRSRMSRSEPDQIDAKAIEFDHLDQGA
ncbi:AfsR/SARP family transcriptional regulator [Streptomyces albireticuli]|uniref:AfsR/SARP family transcriptional regulator n=1 Tax=Streptomyces albireticuli TaxID=1940 RepID=UPI0036A1F486